MPFSLLSTEQCFVGLPRGESERPATEAALTEPCLAAMADPPSALPLWASPAHATSLGSGGRSRQRAPGFVAELPILGLNKCGLGSLHRAHLSGLVIPRTTYHAGIRHSPDAMHIPGRFSCIFRSTNYLHCITNMSAFQCSCGRMAYCQNHSILSTSIASSRNTHSLRYLTWRDFWGGPRWAADNADHAPSSDCFSSARTPYFVLEKVACWRHSHARAEHDGLRRQPETVACNKEDKDAPHRGYSKPPYEVRRSKVHAVHEPPRPKHFAIPLACRANHTTPHPLCSNKCRPSKHSLTPLPQPAQVIGLS